MRIAEPRSAAACLLLCLLGAAALATSYRPGLGGPLVLDDAVHLHPFLARSVPLPRHWWSPLYSYSGPTGRPVAMATFAVDAALAPQDPVRAWKRTNVVLHALTGMLLALLFARLASAAGAPRPAWLGGAALALVWTLHPLHVSTVLYVIQRMALLAALFSVAGMLLYLDGRRRWEAGLPGARWRVGAALLGCLPLAAFSKETGVLLPLLCLALEATVLAGSRGMREWRFLRGLYVACLIAPALLAAGLYAAGYHEQMARAWEAKPYTMGERLLTQARVHLLYAAQALVPLPRLFGFLHDDLAVSRGLLSPPATLACALALAAALFAAVRLRRRAPLVALGLLWFLVGHALEGNLLPLELMFEHRNYLPAAGLLLAAAAGLVAAGATRGTLAGIALAVAAIFAASTWSMATQWRSEATLFASILRLHPDSPWARGLAADWLSRQGAAAEALAVLGEADGPAARLHRLAIECRAGRPFDAGRLADFRASLDGPFDGYTGPLVTGIAGLVLDRACAADRDAFLAALDTAFERLFLNRQSEFRLHMARARLRREAGRAEEAVADLEAAAALRPHDPMPLLVAAEYLADDGHAARADATLARARALAAASGWDYGAVLAGAEDAVRGRAGATGEQAQ